MKKKFILKMINKRTGAYIDSHTNNVGRRKKELLHNLESVNGNGNAIFDRFNRFKGATKDDITIEVYPFGFEVTL